MTRGPLSRYLPRDPRARLVPKVMLGVAAFHVLITLAAVIAAPLWPDSFIAAVQTQLPGLTDVFAHTPRVEALLESGNAAGYPPETRDGWRLHYAVSHLIVALSLIATLAGFALFLLRGIREESYSARVRGLVRTNADPVLLLVIASIPAALAAGVGALLYSGFLTAAHRRGDVFIPFVAFIDLMLLCTLVVLAGLLHRVLVRRTG
jgi:hypothetical protein